MKTILFQGDSITDAGRPKDNDITTGHGYATMVMGELGYAYPNQYKMYNRGISGNRIVDLYARMKLDILNLKPDIMSILIGVNDVWHEIDFSNGVDAEKFYKVYDLLIGEVKEALPDIQMMILEPFVLKAEGIETSWDYFYSELRKRAEQARKIAEKYQLPFISLQDKFDEAAKHAPNTHWLRDGVHPTAAGHELIKREWLKAFHQLEK